MLMSTTVCQSLSLNRMSRPLIATPGVVDQNVQAAELLGHPLDLGGHGLGIGHIEAGYDGGASRRLDQLRGLFGRVLAAGVIDDHRGAAATERLANGPTDSTRSSGNQCHAAF